ncbi:hypothetical protein BDZ89DRAFT_495025 [Hymenopellis radicata]|nr:hypothetical protein BDZ89DRAFT_495025 [Hymenopellis radicata]
MFSEHWTSSMTIGLWRVVGACATARRRVGDNKGNQAIHGHGTLALVVLLSYPVLLELS